LDEEDRQPLPNARVGIYRLMPADSEWTLVQGALTGPDGAFRFHVPPATYRAIFSYQSYSVIVRDDVRVVAGGDTEITVTLTPKPIQLKGLDVKGTQIKSSEASSLSERKKADYVSDAITAEQITKSTDSNAAEALQRVTGLSVVQGRYVYVRGLGERYSSTQVNGASVGTPEPNKRVVPLDVFPSGAVDNIVVQKSYTPDQEGEFGGGVIGLNTKDFTDGQRLTQSVNVGYSAGVAERKFLTYTGGKLDFLGFDDGARDYPQLVKQLAGDRRIVTKGVFGGDGFSREEVQALGCSFNKIWSPRQDGGSPNYNYAASYSRGLRVLGMDLSFLGAFTLGNSFTTQQRETNAYSGTSTRLSPLYLYDVDESDASVLGGAMANLSLKIAEPHTLRIRTLYTRSSENFARVMEGPNYNYGTPLVRISSLDYIERGLFLGVLSGEHKLPAGVGADWRASYSEAMRDEPDRRESIYEANGQGGVMLSGRQAIPLTRIWGDMNEYDRSATASLHRAVGIWGGREAQIKGGVAYRRRSRVSSFRRLGFKLGILGRSALDISQPPESLLIDENIKPGYFELVEGTRENDSYDASQVIRAGYLMGTFPVFDRLDVITGARIETSDQRVEAKSPFVTTTEPVDVRLKTTNTLPSLNVTYRLTDAMNLRGGVSLTVSRPELREMSPFDMYNYETGYSEVGNTEIRSTTIQNWDARWELFPGTRELLAASAFHKSLEHPIENIVEGSSGGYILSPRNGKDGRLTGFEVEMRLGFRRVWDSVASILPLAASSASLDHWAMNANFTRVMSRVEVRTTTDTQGHDLYRVGPLQGQSSYALNAGLHYGSQAFQGSILVSKFGKRLAQVGAGAYPSNLPDIYEYPPVRLDLTVSKSLGSSLSLKLSAENLLDDATEFRQLGLITRRYNSGRVYSLSMNLRG
jgi:TonB dependent receptor/TonB-dependent Receptor Plug Domain/Carboxypeptidase regulatory-like domain